jgi:carbon-monoxide dehydrogenase small subunit
MSNAIDQRSITITVNDKTLEATVETRLTLVDFLRHQLQLTGTHVGCEHGVCGACTVKVNGAIVRGCLVLAAQLDGASVQTIEGLTQTGEIADLQDAFVEFNALQCGFCTAGMLMCASELLQVAPTTDRAQIREYLSGNYCRCTGYQAIVNAVAAVASKRLESHASALPSAGPAQ